MSDRAVRYKYNKGDDGRFIKGSYEKIYDRIGNKITYNSWLSMKCRVREKWKYYEDVTICDEWLGKNGYENFVRDVGVRPSANHTLNRKFGEKIYSKETCEWADKSCQKFDTKRELRNTSGVTGVSFLNRNNYWVAQYSDKNLKTTLVSTKDFYTAVEARLNAELKYRGFSRTILDWSKGIIAEEVYKNGLTSEEVSSLIKKYWSNK